MKVVRCKIVCADADQYKALIDGLCRLYLSHIAKFEAPLEYVVVVRCTVIHAERNLDQLLEAMNLVASKVPETEYQFPPIPSQTKVAA